MFGLSAALHGAITFKDGRVEQSNFHDYAILRLEEMPEVEVNLNTEELGDLGLTNEDEEAIVAFMGTLSDGYRPPISR